MRVVHYLNQFFGGLGGEEKAAVPLETRQGPVGPGKALEQALGADARVVMTLICGDNYAAENERAVVAAALEKVREAQADLFVAGPCFLAGRYGVAAGALCAAVQKQLGIPVITGMARENPGAELYREPLYIVDSGENAARMGEALQKMAKLAQKLIHRRAIGFPAEEHRGVVGRSFKMAFSLADNVKVKGATISIASSRPSRRIGNTGSIS